MKILVLNWRDIKNPAGGGAEILTHELAKGWIKTGHTVTIFSSSFKHSISEETIDDVSFVRKGQWWNVHLLAFFYYLSHHKNVDIIIDEVHWFPFFSALYARKKTIALTCEVANVLFFTLFPYPIALICRGIEKIYLYLYKNVPTMAISESTKKDLIKEGVNSKSITVIRMGLTLPKNLKKYKKEKNSTFIYLARINKQKGIFDAIDAFAKINNEIKSSMLWIVGSGEEEFVKQVRRKVEKLSLSSSVKFFGYVEDKKKFELLAKAHILLIPSAHEGWGLTVAEAASQMTPSIAYNVPGLKDTVINDSTGIIVKNNNPKELAKETIVLINDENKYKKFQKNGFGMAKKMNWNNTTKIALKVLKSQGK